MDAVELSNLGGVGALPGLNLQFVMESLATVFLASLRVGAFLIASAFFGGTSEPLQPRILLAMEPQRSGFTPVRVWQFAALLVLGVAGVWGILQFQPLESQQVSKLSAHVVVSTGITLPKHPQDSSVWLGMSKPALRSLAITRPRLSSRSFRPSSRFLLGSRPRKGS